MIPTVARLNNLYIENNILINWERGAICGIGSRTQATNIFIRKNLIYDSYNNNDPVYINSFPTTGITFSQGPEVDPLFISSIDYHLQPSSPAIGQGIPTSIILDYGGNNYEKNVV